MSVVMISVHRDKVLSMQFMKKYIHVAKLIKVWCVCVRVCVRACVCMHARVCACMRRTCVHMCVCAHVCNLHHWDITEHQGFDCIHHFEALAMLPLVFNNIILNTMFPF